MPGQHLSRILKTKINNDDLTETALHLTGLDINNDDDDDIFNDFFNDIIAINVHFPVCLLYILKIIIIFPRNVLLKLIFLTISLDNTLINHIIYHY